MPQAVIADHPATLAATLAGVPQKDSINPGNVHRKSPPSLSQPVN